MLKNQILTLQDYDLNYYIEKAGLKNVESEIKALSEFRYRSQSNDNAFEDDPYNPEGLSH